MKKEKMVLEWNKITDKHVTIQFSSIPRCLTCTGAPEVAKIEKNNLSIIL